MHVGLNLIFLVPGATGGTETYARELIPQLVAASPAASFTAFLNRETAEGPMLWSDVVRTVVVPVRAANRVEWVRGEQQLLPRLASRAGIDVLHSLANTAPVRGPFRRVVTIHDLHFRRVPEAHLGVARYGMSVLVPLAARRSRRVIAPSMATRDDVVSMLHVPCSRVDVVPEGIGRGQAVEPLREVELRRRLELDDRQIVLSVSAKRPHKNLIRLIEALALVPPERRPHLVIPGYPTPHEQELRRLTAQLELERDVRLLGWVDAETLEGLYAAATCLVCPSLHEGFGLPVLEAMSRGLPVACSGGGALSEVAGDAALIFDPRSSDQIARAIERLVGDAEERRRLRHVGFERAAGFSWTRTAHETILSYERALGSRS